MNDELPSNIELEQVVLGGLLVKNTLIEHMADSPPEYFFDPVHQEIFEAIRRRALEQRIASPVTLKSEFIGHAGLEQLGGAAYLVRLAGAGMTIEFPKLVEDLADLFARRTAIIACRAGMDKLASFADTDAISDVLGSVEVEISTAVSAIAKKKLTQSWLSSTISAVAKINDAYQAGAALGISTGIPALNNKIGALAPGDVIVLAGRPSMGKTTLATVLAMNAAKAGTGVFFASLEMYEDVIAQRALSQILAQEGHRIAYTDMMRGLISEGDFRQVIDATKRFEGLPIEFCDPSCRTLVKLKSAVAAGERKLSRAGFGMGLIVIDYLQLVNPTGLYRMGDANGRVAAALEAIKAMATHYRCPVVLLSQLNRQVEMRDPPIPMLSDLRDSGSIEQDADVILFTFRQEHYTQKEIERVGQDNAKRADLEAALSFQRNKMTVIVAKQRNGPTGRCDLHCELPYNLICDRDDVPRSMEDMDL